MGQKPWGDGHQSGAVVQGWPPKWSSCERDCIQGRASVQGLRCACAALSSFLCNRVTDSGGWVIRRVPWAGPDEKVGAVRGWAAPPARAADAPCCQSAALVLHATDRQLAQPMTQSSAPIGFWLKASPAAHQ